MIIGLNGKIGAGKDTVADFLVSNHGYKKVGFSDVMYDAVCALWGITLEEALQYKDPALDVWADLRSPRKDFGYGGMTWRTFLQRFGTDMGREVFGPDFWVEQFAERYLSSDDNTDYVVRDVRFNNEAELITDYAGDIWHIVRPGYEGDEHVSEAGINPSYIRGDIGNDGTMDELLILLSDWMLAAYGPRHSVSGS